MGENMELSERKIRILENIVSVYIDTAEPVGSRTLSKKIDMGLSSATIRNEMSDLEEMGLILAPHASAGRVPSDKGYRLFVDRLLQRQERQDLIPEGPSSEILRFLESVIANNINQIDSLMKETAKAISLLTNYTAVASERALHVDKVGLVQLMPLDENNILLTVVTASKKVKNYQIRAYGQAMPDYDEMLALSRALNNELSGCRPEGLNAKTKKLTKTAFKGHEKLCELIILALKSLLTDGDKRQAYAVGIKNILAFPEFYDHDKARALFETLEEQEHLLSLLGTDTDADGGAGVSVVIGSENTLSKLKDVSVIKTTYNLGKSLQGADENNGITGDIAIIGPTRMDYSQAVKTLQGMARHIESVLQALESREGL